MITDLRGKVAGIAGQWKGAPGMVTGALQQIQNTFGYLPEEEVEVLAQELQVPLSRLYSVATFYSFFRLSPPGVHHLQVCEGTACHVLGAEQISAKLERDLKIGQGDLSQDGQFSLEKVRCLGCCSMAPVVRIGDKTLGRVRQKDLPRLLQPYRSKEASGEDKSS